MWYITPKFDGLANEKQIMVTYVGYNITLTPIFKTRQTNSSNNAMNEMCLLVILGLVS